MTRRFQAGAWETLWLRATPYVAGAFILLTGHWVAAQWVATQLGYAPALGGPWLRVGARVSVYSPHAFWRWYGTFHDQAPCALDRGLIPILASLVLAMISVRVLSWYYREETAPSPPLPAATTVLEYEPRPSPWAGMRASPPAAEPKAEERVSDPVSVARPQDREEPGFLPDLDRVAEEKPTRASRRFPARGGSPDDDAAGSGGTA